MRNKKLIGTGVALITPFNEDFTIDFNSLGVLIDHLIENKINYFVVMGTTAESATLSIEEQNKILKYIKEKTNNRVPIVFGLGGNDTNSILNRIHSLDFHGIEAVLSVCPYYNKPSQRGLLEHYSKISEVSPVDIILYNVPSRTALNIDVNTVVTLAERHSNIIGIKEASGNISQCMELILKCPSDFMIISGDDKMTFSIMSLGGVGVISVQAMAFPLLFSSMVKLILEKKIGEAKKCHYNLLKSVDMFYVDGNPPGVKQALKTIGICSSNQVRLPLVKMDSTNAKKISLLVCQTLDNKI